MSIASGFLQQWLGPQRILVLTTLPAMLSWFLVVIGPDTAWLVVLSRFMSGISSGFLSANVYAADMAHREHRQSLKMMEASNIRSTYFHLLVIFFCFIFRGCFVVGELYLFMPFTLRFGGKGRVTLLLSAPVSRF